MAHLTLLDPGADIFPKGLAQSLWPRIYGALQGLAVEAFAAVGKTSYALALDAINSPWLDLVAIGALSYPEWQSDIDDIAKRARIRMWQRLSTCQGTRKALALALEAYGIGNWRVGEYHEQGGLFDEFSLDRNPRSFAIAYWGCSDKQAKACEKFIKAVWPVGCFKGLFRVEEGQVSLGQPVAVSRSIVFAKGETECLLY